MDDIDRSRSGDRVGMFLRIGPLVSSTKNGKYASSELLDKAHYVSFFFFCLQPFSDFCFVFDTISYSCLFPRLCFL